MADNCDKYNMIIDKYIEGRVSYEEKKLLEEHIKTCDKCQKEVSQLAFIINTCNSLKSLEVPSSFMPCLHNKLLQVRSDIDSNSSSFLGDFLKDIKTLLLEYFYNSKKILAIALSVFIISTFLIKFIDIEMFEQKPIYKEQINTESNELKSLNKEMVDDNKELPLEFEAKNHIEEENLVKTNLSFKIIKMLIIPVVFTITAVILWISKNKG